MRVHRSEPAPGNLEDIFLYLAPATAPRRVARSSASSMSPTTRAYAVTNERIDILAVIHGARGLWITLPLTLFPS
jgi:plasmid stabilization system protein ParE